MDLAESLQRAAILSATSAEKPCSWSAELQDARCGGSGMLGCHGNGCSVAVLAECIWVEAVLGCPETIPPGPKTMVLSASLGQSELSCMFEI